MRSPRDSASFPIFSDLRQTPPWSSANCGCSRSQPTWTPPIPTLFKERLFVYLSRFCEVRYCITRRCDFVGWPQANESRPRRAASARPPRYVLS
jgi:hypothetical protein